MRPNFRCFIVLGGVVASGCASIPPAGGIEFDIAGVSPAAARAFRAAAVEAKGKVANAWGCAHTGPIRVVVRRHYRISKALVPAWRGNAGAMQFHARGVRTATAPIVHEFVHVCAPNQNRFLAEGLAVHFQATLGGNRAYPNFARPLNALAVAYGGIALARLDAIATPMRLRLVGKIDQKGAYLVAGSFVGFLIARHGLDKFRRLYALTPLRPGVRGGGGDTARYRTIYRRSLETLDDEWRAWLRTMP